jgi:hypothetical protein
MTKQEIISAQSDAVINTVIGKGLFDELTESEIEAISLACDAVNETVNPNLPPRP